VLEKEKIRQRFASEKSGDGWIDALYGLGLRIAFEVIKAVNN
jgi:hypothetical protein